MVYSANNLSRSASQQERHEQSTGLQGPSCNSGNNKNQHEHQHQQQQQLHQRRPNYSSSSSSLTSGIGQSDQSICNDKVSTSITDIPCSDNSKSMPTTGSSTPINLKDIDSQLKEDIRKFVDNIFRDSQSISLEKKAEFGQLVRTPEARLLFAMFVDDYRVNSKRVSELTFYSLAQYFSITLLECLLAEDFRPAKIIMNMMFTYYYEQSCDKLPPRDRPPPPPPKPASESDDEIDADGSKIIRTYLYTLLKDQQIFKSIRFWTSAFYETVIIERNNHPVFVNRVKGKMSNERRNEELDCSKNITFGLLGSFIHNMSLLDLSHEFCQEFLDKHSTIADLTGDQLEMLRSNMNTMFEERSASILATTSPASRSEKLATFLHKLSTRLNQAHQTR